MTHTLHNPFHHAIRNGRTQIGLWLASASASVAEMATSTGFDWLVIDAEHVPNDLHSVLRQLQAIDSGTLALAGSQPHAVVRLPEASPVLVKQYLELGAQTLLVPMVDTADQAAQMAQAMRYPPLGNRGIGSGIARSSRWGLHADYLHEANSNVCLLVQVETVEGLANLEAIARTPGVDGVFIGPADLCASMGKIGQPNHPEVQAAILQAGRTLKAVGKPCGILSTNETAAQMWIDAGYVFVAVGVDMLLLKNAAQTLRAKFPPTVDFHPEVTH